MPEKIEIDDQKSELPEDRDDFYNDQEGYLEDELDAKYGDGSDRGVNSPVSRLGEAEDDEIDDEDSDEYEAEDYFKEDSGRVRAIVTGNAQKKGSKNGRRMFVLAGVSGLIMSVLLGFLMFMTIYRSEHLRNLLWDYRFAKFHYQTSKRIRSNLNAMQTLTPGSSGTLQFEKTSLGQKLRGYSPDKALQSLSDGKMQLQVEQTSVFGETKITGFTDPDTGKLVTPESAGGRAQFEERLLSTSDRVLGEANHTKYFQKETRKLLNDNVKISFGDRFRAYQEKLAEKRKGKTGEPTPEEKSQSLASADADRASGGATGSPIDGSVGEAADAAFEDAHDGTLPTDSEIGNAISETPKPIPTEGRWASSKTRAKLTKGVSVYSDISEVVFVVTMACIVRDVSGSIKDALATRIDAPMRMAAELFGEAEQFKSGDNASMDVAAERNKQLENVDQSAAIQRINGTPEDEISASSGLSVSDLPFSFFGLSLGTVATLADTIKSTVDWALLGPIIPNIPGVSDVADSGITWLCSQVLDPTVQLGLLVLDAVATVASLGTSKTFAAGVVQGVRTAIQIGVGVGLSKIVFEYLLPKILFSLVGSGGLLSNGDPNNGNKLDLGATLLASQYGGMAGGSKITLAQAERDQSIAMNLVKQNAKETYGALAAINPHNPYSLVSQLSVSLPGDPAMIPGALLGKSLGFMFSPKSISTLGNLFNARARAEGPTYLETYGVEQIGIPDSVLEIDPVQNAEYVDGTPGKLQELKDKYQKCFTDSLSKKALNEDDYSMCEDEDAQRLGLYNIDNCAGAGSLATGTDANNCSIFDGAGDISPGSTNPITGTSTGSANGSAATNSNANISNQYYTGTVPTGAARLGDYKKPGLKYDWQHIYMAWNESTNPKCQWTDKVPAGAETRPGNNQPGINALNVFLDQRWGGGSGTHATCKGGPEPKGVSKHGEGRAWDSYANAGTAEGLKNGNEMMGWLIANADALGLQYVKFWRVEWDHQQGINCVEDAADQSSHYGHVHWELNWDGALMKTPFFNGAPYQNNPIQISQEVCPVVR